MNRRQLFSALPAFLLPVPVLAAPKRETLPEYLKRITPFGSDKDEEWEVTMFRKCNGESHRLEYSASALEGEHNKSLNNFYFSTDKGLKAIDPQTLELVPFTLPS